MMEQKRALAVAVCAGLALSAAAQAQFAIVNNLPGTFTDISGTGTALSTGDDDSEAFVSAVTNALVSNPNLYASTNGNITDSMFTSWSNTALPVSGLNFGLFPFWDDLYEDGAVYYQTVQENGVNVEVIQWVNVSLLISTVDTTFEVKIYQSGPVYAQFIFQDADALNNGSSATVGLQVNGAAETYSYNQPVISNGLVLSVVQGVTGACCLPDGSCAALSGNNCANSGGVYRGDNSTCGASSCPQGACCTDSGCSIYTEAQCLAQSGTYHGDNSSCAGVNCPVNLVQNGGFETGDFTGWTQFGNTGFSAVNSGQWVTVSPHGGTYEAHFGPVGSTGGIQQTINVTAGTMIDISFWYAAEAETPNFFSADLGGTNLVSFTDDTSHPNWTHFSFSVAAPTDNPVLSFTTQDDPSYIYLDDIRVTAGGSTGPTCYPNCDLSTTVPFLNVNDFICFQGKFAAGDTYANCDHSTTIPVLNVNDFICFQSKFAAGCSAP